MAVLLAGVLLAAEGAATQEFAGRVVGVVDGDTLHVLRDGRSVTVRLQEIDCPEKGQAFGARAKQFASELAFRQTVTVRIKGLDRNGRALGEVILPDGRSLNRELVRAGFAWWFRKYSSDEELARLEAEARTDRRGLWADPDPVPPWDFRQVRRMSPTRP